MPPEQASLAATESAFASVHQKVPTSDSQGTSDGHRMDAVDGNVTDER
jgi:hypothetical protein